MTIDHSPVNPPTFKIILTGFREDISIDTAREAFAGLLKATPSQIDRLFNALPYVLKKQIQADQAFRYKAAIEVAGGTCRIEPEVSEAVATLEPAPPVQVELRPRAAVPLAVPAAITQAGPPKINQISSTRERLPTSFSQRIVIEVRRFFLLDIPARSIPLNFKLPTASTRAKAGSGSSAELYEAEDDPLEFLKLLYARIKFLNFAKLGTRARLRANRDVLKLFYALAVKHMVELAKTGGVPETEDRRECLTLTSDIASILVTSCAIVFANYYEGSKYHYARNRKQLLKLASCIFELLLLKQRARALRYQLLDSSDWSMANTVFHVMRAYEDVEQPMPTLISELNIDSQRAKKSLSDQFILLQIYAWFDLLRLPTTLHWVIGSYLVKVEDAVQIKEDAARLEPNEMLVYCYGKQPAEAHRLAVPTGPALILNMHNLIEAIREDCLAKGHANTRDASHVMPRFAHFETADHFVIRNQLLSRLNPEKESVVSSGEKQVDDLRIFVGFSAIFSMLRHRKSEFGSEERLEDRLSKRSAALAVDGTEIRRSLWSFSFQSEQMTRLTTTEAADTTAMGIGMMLAYGAGDEIDRPRLAVVSRILRPYGRILELDMRFIASFCEPVALSFNAVKAPGLLVYDPRKGGHWALAFPPRDLLIGVDKVEIHRDKKVIAVELTAFLDASNDFYLLDTTLTSSQLGFYGEPQYPAPTPKQTNFRIF